MFAIKGRLKVTLLVIGIFAGGVYILLMPITAESHSNNEEPYTNHKQILEQKYGFCGASYLIWKVGDWWYREACLVIYWEKARWQNYHGVNPLTCSACGQKVDSSGEHWVSDSTCDWGGYYSCISSRSRCNEN